MTGRRLLVALTLALVVGAGLYLRTATWAPSVADPVHPRRSTAALRPAPPVEPVTRMVEREPVPFRTRVLASGDLALGESRVVREGREGVVRSVYSVRSTGAGIVALRLVARDVIRPPVTRIVAKGTAPPTSAEGIATWYEREGMVAAHPTLPVGTRVLVTSLATGNTVTVIIDDRGPFGPGRIIDLSDDAFVQLAPLSRGTLQVRIAW